MDPFRDHLIVRAATIDELLSHDFETLPGLKGDAETAAQRLAAWCRACASGDWSLFNRRLERDGLTIEKVLARFATARRKVSVPPSGWRRPSKAPQRTARRRRCAAKPSRTRSSTCSRRCSRKRTGGSVP